MSIFRRKPNTKPVVIDPLMAALIVIKACEQQAVTNDHCRIGDELAYICGEHMPLAMSVGVGEIVG